MGEGRQASDRNGPERSPLKSGGAFEGTPTNRFRRRNTDSDPVRPDCQGDFNTAGPRRTRFTRAPGSCFLSSSLKGVGQSDQVV